MQIAEQNSGSTVLMSGVLSVFKGGKLHLQAHIGEFVSAYKSLL